MTATPLRARVCGIGLIAPGIADWQTGARILAGRQAWQPAPLAIPATEFLPSAERRRAGKAIRLALGCGHQAILDSGHAANGVASVFASTDVDAENTHQICVALTGEEPSLSPTRFHNSVQNAVSGYWTILTGSRAPTTMVMGGDEILAIGLLEAMTQAVQAMHPVLLVVFDVPMPAPLFATHPIEEGGAIALVLDARAGAGAVMKVTLQKGTAEGPAHGEAAADTDAADGNRELDALRRVHPVGAALPILAMLARSEAGANRGGQARLELDRYHALQVVIEA